MSTERFPVEAGHALLFARSIGDFGEQYEALVDGTPVPPTFVQASNQFDRDWHLRPRPGERWFGSGATPTGVERPAGAGTGTGVLHAEQRFEYHRPVVTGDVLRSTTVPGKTWEKEGRKGGTLTFTETVTEFRDDGGELVVTATMVTVRTAKVPELGGS